MSDHSRTNRLAVWLIVACTAGCAQSVVRPMSENRETSLPPPTRVLVYDPAVGRTDVGQSSLTGHAQDDRDAISKETAAVFAAETVDGITKLGLRAEHAGPNTPVPDHAVLVISQLLAVDEGNEAQRVMVGFGSGASRIDARVQVYYSDHGSRTKLLEFETHSDSGKMPGAAVQQIVAKNAEQATDYLSEHFGKHGWISPDHVQKAKR